MQLVRTNPGLQPHFDVVNLSNIDVSINDPRPTDPPPPASPNLLSAMGNLEEIVDPVAVAL